MVVTRWIPNKLSSFNLKLSFQLFQIELNTFEREIQQFQVSICMCFLSRATVMDMIVLLLCVSVGSIAIWLAYSLGTDLETGTVLSCHHIFLGITDFKNKSTSSSSICCLTVVDMDFTKTDFSIVKWLLNSRTAYC